MKCDVCDNEATVFLTQIINGQMTTVNLCDACSKAKGVTDETGFGLAEAFLGGNQPPSVTGSRDPVCPSCGFTAGQLKKIGRMGCPDCYEAFRDGLDNLLKAMHKGTRHVGKTPTRLMSEGQLQGSLEMLGSDLEAAVKEERYEDAARLKQQIQELKEKITSAP